MAALRDRHLRYFLEWAEIADPQTRGPNQAVWLESLDQDYDNLLAALEWSTERDPQSGLRLAGALGFFWWMRNKHQEGFRWLSSFINHPQNETRNRSRCYALEDFHFEDFYFDAPIRIALESLAISRDRDQTSEAFALYLLGWVCYQKRMIMLRRVFDKSLAIYQSLGDQWGLARIYLNLGNMDGFQGNIPSQREYLERSLAACRQAGDLRGMAIALNNLASVLVDAECDLQGGRRLAEESIDIYHRLKAYGDIDNALIVYGLILSLQGEYPYMSNFFQELEDINRRREI
jgi:tetratricopeptide (TPR) repeat protein